MTTQAGRQVGRQVGRQAGRQAGGQRACVPLVRLRRSMSSIGIGPNMRLTSFQGWGPLDSTRGREGMEEGEGDDEGEGEDEI